MKRESVKSNQFQNENIYILEPERTFYNYLFMSYRKYGDPDTKTRKKT